MSDETEKQFFLSFFFWVILEAAHLFIIVKSFFILFLMNDGKTWRVFSSITFVHRMHFVR